MTQILQFVDKLFLALPADKRTLAAIVLLALFVWSVFRLFKGLFIYLILIVILIPAVWPALKIIGLDLFKVFGYIIYRI